MGGDKREENNGENKRRERYKNIIHISCLVYYMYVYERMSKKGYESYPAS